MHVYGDVTNSKYSVKFFMYMEMLVTVGIGVHSA